MFDRLIDICHGGMFALYLLCTIQLLTGKTKNDTPIRVRHSAALVMLMLTLQVVGWYCFPSKTELKELIGVINLSIAPFVVFMMMELTGYKKVNPLRMLVHIMPFAASIVAVLILEHKGHSATLHAVYGLFQCFILIYVSIYTYLFIDCVRKYNKEVEEFYSNPEDYSLHWLNRQIVLLLVLIAVFITLQLSIGTNWAKAAYYLISMFFWCDLCSNVLNMKSVNQMKQVNEKENSMKAQEYAAALEPFMRDMERVCREQGLYKDEKLTREEVAVAMNTNHTTLSEKLKKATDLTFSEYIGKIRLEEACKLLESSEENIEKIIYDCGYRNKSTFYRAFTNAYNCTPKVYRYKARNEKKGK